MSDLKNFNDQEAEVKNKIKSQKINHIFLLLLFTLAAVLLIVISSSGEKSADTKVLKKSLIYLL